MEDRETINPNIIKGFDFSFPFFSEIFFDEDWFLSLFIRFEKGLFTLIIILVNYSFINLNSSLW